MTSTEEQEHAEIESLICPYCQAQTLPGDIYCAQCGNTLVECDEFGFEVFS